MNVVTVEMTERPSNEALGLIVNGVRSYNYAMRGHEAPRPVAFFLRDQDSRIVGGVSGDLWGRSVHVSAMWVDERYRGQGYGASLLRELEAYAAARGHVLAYVETLSYQAAPFYQKQGYRVFGALEGIAEDCTYFFLRKDLLPASPISAQTER
ncbi:MAG TPA: GNAT family N-acetyltransferase [Herpetosiphonaceae bacterium]